MLTARSGRDLATSNCGMVPISVWVLPAGDTQTLMGTDRHYETMSRGEGYFHY